MTKCVAYIVTNHGSMRVPIAVCNSCMAVDETSRTNRRGYHGTLVQRVTRAGRSRRPAWHPQPSTVSSFPFILLTANKTLDSFSNALDCWSKGRNPYWLRYWTPWIQIDNVFYRLESQLWAELICYGRDVVCRDVREHKNAVNSLQQLIREHGVTQKPIWSP